MRKNFFHRRQRFPNASGGAGAGGGVCLVQSGQDQRLHELFDEGTYVDTNYEVNLGQAIFLCTCNFSNEQEIKQVLGPAMFSRIGCCIEYSELSTEQKKVIIKRWYEEVVSSLQDDEKDIIRDTDILDWFQDNAERYDNIRILKTKLENAIFDKLADVFILHPANE